MARGDHFFVWRRHLGIPYQHHGIDLGDGTVVHFTDGHHGVAGPGGNRDEFEIRRTELGQVTRNGCDSLHQVVHSQPLASDEVVRRALSQVGRRGYDLLYDNCEHFACWCVIDREESSQVSAAFRRVGAAGVKAMCASSVRIASRMGTARVVRGASPWLVVADAAQWLTEATGHHAGLTNPQRRRAAAMAVGGVTAAGIGALGGPAAMAVAGGIWVAGELAGEATRRSFERVRTLGSR